MAGEAGCMHEAEVELGLRANTCTHTSWWANRRPAAAPAGHDSEVASIAWPRLAVGLHGSPHLQEGAGRGAQPVGYCILVRKQCMQQEEGRKRLNQLRS